METVAHADSHSPWPTKLSRLVFSEVRTTRKAQASANGKEPPSRSRRRWLYLAATTLHFDYEVLQIAGTYSRNPRCLRQ